METTDTGVTEIQPITNLSEKGEPLLVDNLLLQTNTNSFKISYQTLISNLVDNVSVFLDNNNKLETRPANIEQVYPIGSIYMNTDNSSNPSSYLGFGVWERYNQGRVLISEGLGVDDNGVNEQFNLGDNGGSYTHKLTLSEVPQHTHTSNVSITNQSSVENNAQNAYYTMYRTKSVPSTSTGGNQPHNNIQPYLTVYMWVRVS